LIERCAAFFGGLDIDFGFPESFDPVEHRADVMTGGHAAVAEGGHLAIDPSALIVDSTIKVEAGARLIVCEGASIRNTGFLVYDDALVIIGPNVRLTHARIHCYHSGAILVGEASTWESCAAIAAEQTLIAAGRDCMFSNDIVLRTSDGHGIFDLSTRERLNAPANVLIGNHVWLGNGCRINKGTVVHAGSVVAQRAVVSGEVDARSIYGGIPARKLRDGIGWSRDEDFEGIPADYRNVMVRVRKGGRKKARKS
jgi:acetyltransferase-like isoleucine patch superfamily enzyme